jgi:hypothetical protein
MWETSQWIVNERVNNALREGEQERLARAVKGARETRMNGKQTSNVLNLGAHVPVQRQITALALAAWVALLVAVTAYAAIPDINSDSAFFAANPELMAAGRYTAVSAESAYLAANPELSVARRYAAAETESAYMAANPELSAARRYAAAEMESAYLAANPELSAAQRYDAAKAVDAALAFPPRHVFRFDASSASQSVNAVAQRHGYYGAFLAATSGQAVATSSQ